MAYYVIDEDNQTSWHANEKDSSDDGAESFTSQDDAEARAKELALAEPGKKFVVATAISYAIAPIGNVEIKDA